MARKIRLTTTGLVTLRLEPEAERLLRKFCLLTNATMAELTSQILIARLRGLEDDAAVKRVLETRADLLAHIHRQEP